MHAAHAPALLLLFACSATAQEWSVASPDNRIVIAVSLEADGRLAWRATREGKPVLERSPLGVRRHDQTFQDGLKLIAASEPRRIDERYRLPHGKRRDHHVAGVERTITFANARNARLEVVLRAHNDGVAIRYRFPETDAQRRRVFGESTGFAVPAGSTGWMLPHQRVHRYGPAYEDFFQEVAAGKDAPLADGWSFPALFKTPGGPWLLISESALDGSYPGAHLAASAPNGIYRIAFPDPEEGLGVGEIHPASTLPWTLPWRVVAIADEAVKLIESDIINDLAPATRVKDTSWIRPGRSSWSWWSKSDSSKNALDLKSFIDLAAEMRWEYSLIDANWDQMKNGSIGDVLAHARAKKIGPLLWYNSGGPHNDVTEAPRDRMHRRDVRRAELARLQQWGVKGIKVDFWHSDKPDRIQQYRDILEDAADFHISVNFHGSTIPRGWSREYPHLMSMEAVFGAEQYKFRQAFTTRAAWLNTVLPFTRNVIGPMDYTPVTFTDVRYPRTTTNAHELAQSVVFESGIQHFADSVEAYRQLPAAAKEFLQQVPAAWDETRGIAGEPGKHVVIARRDGRTWYVGALNADIDQAVTVALDFLGAGSWSMTEISDGSVDRDFKASTKSVTSKDVVEISMRPRGGFVLRLSMSSTTGSGAR
jgi:alpha-ketoglutarate-dependent taurine dioxygenase